MPNGLRVIAIENPVIPLLAAQAVVRNGSEVDPPRLAGLAWMTAKLLTRGTRTKTAAEIADAAESAGGSFESAAEWDSSRATVTVLSPQGGRALDMLAAIVREPSFEASEVERLRRGSMDSLQLALGQPRVVAFHTAARAVFGNGPYAHPSSGTVASMQRITRGHISGMHGSYYRPDNAILILCGSVKPARAFTLAESLFGDWAKPADLSPPAVRDSGGSTSKRRVIVVDMPAAAQVAVAVALRGVSRTDGDFYTALVANSLLGGGYSARLNQEIRIRRGLSYFAGSRMDARRSGGLILASAQTTGRSAVQVAALILEQLRSLAEDPIPEAELAARKESLIGQFHRPTETVEGLVSLAASFALHGVELAEIAEYSRRLRGVTAADVRHLVSSRLSPDNASVVLAGNAASFEAGLRSRFHEAEVIPLSELDLSTASLRQSRMP